MFILTSREFLLNHIESIRQLVTVRSDADTRRLAALEDELALLARRHKTLSSVRIVVFVFLYASVLSNFALPAVTQIVQTFTLVANLLGVGILSLAALYLTWRLGQLWNRMMVVGSNVITIYEKHNNGSKPLRAGKTARTSKKN